MRITVDNLEVSSNIKYTECDVIQSTLIFKPSEVRKYLGSISKQASTGVGISQTGGAVKVISLEYDDYTKCNWCLISYNNKYYYTPNEYINTSNFVDKNSSSENSDIEETIDSSRILRSASTLEARSPNISGEGTMFGYISRFNEPSTAKALIEVYTDDTDYLVREMPYESSKTLSSDFVKSRIDASSIFPVQSLWLDYSTGQRYYGTTFFSEEGKTQCYYISEDCVKEPILDASAKFTEYWAVCFAPTPIASYRLGDGSNMGEFACNDFFHATFTAGDGNFYQHTINNGNVYAIRPVTMNGMSPYAHSNDWFNPAYFGKIQNCNADTIGRAIDVNRFYKDHPTTTRRIRSSDASYFINPSTKFSSGAGSNDNAEYKKLSSVLHIKADSYLITYNKTFFNGKYYWICSLPDEKYRHIWYIVEDHPDLNWVVHNYSYTDNDTPTVNSPGYSLEHTTSDIVSDWTESADKYAKGGSPTTTNAGGDFVEPYYNTELDPGDTKWKFPGIIEDVDEKFDDVTEMWNEGVEDLHSAMRYELQEYAPLYTMNDSRHINRINRFRLMPTNSGLATKSFIFMTRPDLHLYDENETTGMIDRNSMNPDLKRLPTFKYIAHMQNACQKIMGSLQHSSSTASNYTPWLSIISNQATGYTPSPREMDYTEIGETFHGNKIVYAEPTFKHKIAGTVSIPFRERRDLSLYYTLKMWVEYIQAVTLGRCSPRRRYITDMELDYAVSLYFVQTDETMENILYWEKLTGVIPLTVPDDFFEWNEKDHGKNMEYTINFAYSFRTVQDEMHLCEINNLYSFADRRDGGLAYFDGYNMSYDSNFDAVMVKVADSFGTLDSSKGINVPNAHKDELSSYIGNRDKMKRLYYSNNPKINIDDVSPGYEIKVGTENSQTSYVKAKFLPNYIPDIGMHGIPYVTGPFITREKDRRHDYDYTYYYGTPADNGIYKLRWV